MCHWPPSLFMRHAGVKPAACARLRGIFLRNEACQCEVYALCDGFVMTLHPISALSSRQGQMVELRSRFRLVHDALEWLICDAAVLIRAPFAMAL